MTKNNSKQDILRCAKKEFLEKGYKGASLRKIAKMAGVTTGAFYAHFSDKSELFDVLVQPAVHKFTDQYAHISATYDGFIDDRRTLQSTIWDMAEKNMRQHIKEIFVNLDVFKLLLLCADGTKYSDYIERIIDKSVEETKRYFEFLKSEGIEINSITDNELHILCHAHFSAIYEIVKHDMTLEEAYDYLGTITKFFVAGWKSILDIR